MRSLVPARPAPIHEIAAHLASYEVLDSRQLKLTKVLQLSPNCQRRPACTAKTGGARRVADPPKPTALPCLDTSAAGLDGLLNLIFMGRSLRASGRSGLYPRREIPQEAQPFAESKDGNTLLLSHTSTREKLRIFYFAYTSGGDLICCVYITSQAYYRHVRRFGSAVGRSDGKPAVPPVTKCTKRF